MTNHSFRGGVFSRRITLGYLVRQLLAKQSSSLGKAKQIILEAQDRRGFA